ncbi:hypothetical protein SELMODRAFT_442893 [Selaginella moellendorffii]|uniref:non-specific serine/threonine protein kinase n=2 Tax=Selaginella moellendorffii TaxID=88036 RepID=D8RWY5_SELML|nr:hypothetical protein SELMODRAFT_442893 [Selaginella moellendorffii]
MLLENLHFSLFTPPPRRFCRRGRARERCCHGFVIAGDCCSIRHAAKAQISREPADRSGGFEGRNPLIGAFHEKGDVVAGKYRIVGVLGSGGVGVTYEAETERGDAVAIKAMSLRNMKGWKDLDLFEREARVLKSLQHSGIPEYIDFFEIENEKDKGFYIVQKVAKGKSLAKLVEEGWRVSEQEVKDIAIEILDVLKYLGSLRPPVIHRDIKPDNIILDEATGKVKVVDFGAVQDTTSSATFIGSTVVGTYGYMAPEQFQNRATLQTDLYGLGGTLLFMLSGRSPATFPQKRLRVDFQNFVSASPSMTRVVEKLLEPAPEDRYQSADEVIRALQDGESPVVAGESFFDYAAKSRKPYGTKVVLTRFPDSLTISIPRAGVGAAAATGTFALAWNSFLLLWTFGAPLPFVFFSIPFWFVGYGLSKDALSALTVTTFIELTKRYFSIEWKVGNFWTHRVQGLTQDITSVELCAEWVRNRRRIKSCCIREGVKVHDFGGGLELVEKNWLVNEISSFLGIPPPPPVLEETFVDNRERDFWGRDRDFHDDFW